jgi:glycosyltransferase involved in cell wall biosynthesis
MKFSIVTPTRNALPYLVRCVGSVRGQTDAAFEHIVQDACSTDGTSEWLLTQSDLSAATEPDEGMYDAINRGWSRSKGDVLSWLNSDEQYLPGTLQLVSRAFEENPEIDFLYGNHIVVDADGLGIAARREIRLSSFYISHGFLYAASCTMFFRRRLLDSGILILDSTYRYASDMDLVLRLLAANRRGYHMNRYLSLFTFDGNNLSCSPRMIAETEAIREKHGGASSGLVRRVAQVGRIIERAIKGSYLPRRVSYQFAVDDRPKYREVVTPRLGSQYVTQ